MSQVLNTQLTKSKEIAYTRAIEDLLVKLKENNKVIRDNNKQTERLRRSNDKSFNRLKQVVESLKTY